MKRTILFFMVQAFVILTFYQAGFAQEFYTEGRISVNDKTIDIIGSAAYWDSDNRLLVFFYPFKLSEKRLKRMDGGYPVDFAVSDYSDPKPINWEYIPYAMMQITFTKNKKEKNLKNVNTVLLACFGFLPKYFTVNIHYVGQETKDFFDVLEVGEDNGDNFIKMVTKGSDDSNKDKCMWEFKNLTRIFPIEK